MPGTPFKSMTREPIVGSRYLYHLHARVERYSAGTPCEKCGGSVYRGDWPFCRAGHPEDHKRD